MFAAKNSVDMAFGAPSDAAEHFRGSSRLQAYFRVLSFRAEWICRFGYGKLSNAADEKIESSGLRTEKNWVIVHKSPN